MTKSFHISNLGLNPTTDARFAPGIVDAEGYVTYDDALYEHLMDRLRATEGWREARRVRDELRAELGDAGEIEIPTRNAYTMAITAADRETQLRDDDED